MFEREALSILENKRRAEILRRESLIAELKKDAGFLGKYNALNGARFDLAKAKAFESGVKAAEERLSVAQNAFNDYLATVNVAPALLEETPECKECGDTGRTPDGKRCACLAELIKKLNLESGDLPHTLSDFSLFDLTKYKGDAAKRAESAVEWLKKWTAAYPEITRAFVTVYGATGVGKTHLAAFAANAFIDRGFDVTFIKAYKLNELFLTAKLSPLGERQRILQPVYGCDLLVIDDLGSEEFYKNVTAEYLYMTIAEREKLTTIITTNLSPAMIKDRYQERVYSRLFSAEKSAAFALSGEDLRLARH